MSTRIVEAGQLRYTLAMEPAAQPGTLFQVVLRGRAVDELTGEPPRVPVRISSPLPGTTPRGAPGGLVGLLGLPSELFPALDAQTYSVPFSLFADRYLPLAGEAIVPQDIDFPERFVPMDVGDVALHREPVIITGVVLQRANGLPAPVAGATVEVIEIWTALPPADGSVAPQSPTLISVRPPLHFARAAGVGPLAGQVRRREMVPVVGEDKELLAEVAPGENRLWLSDRIGLADGEIVLLDADPSIEELAVIETVDTAAAVELPAAVVLTHAVAYRHRAGARVTRVTPQLPGPSRELSHDAITGDTCLVLGSLAGLEAARVVEISGGAAPDELHFLSRFVTSTDGEGRFAFPPLGRVAQLTLQAGSGVDTSELVPFVPDYARRENRLDIEF